MTCPEVRRLFLALWPEAAVRAALLEVQRGLPADIGRAVKADNLHITLAFLGSTPAQRQSCIEAALDDVVAQCFSLQLDRLGFWRKPQVLWVGSERSPPPLQTLVDGVGRAVAQCGCRLDSRPFQIHLTLFRKVRKPPRELPVVAPIQWPVESFALVESVTAASGVCYKVLKTWALGTAVAGRA